MTTWQHDKRWADRFVSEIKRILGEHLIADASVEDDQHRATDLIVMSKGKLRIGCRVRRFKYHRDFRDQFTLRLGRPSRIETELQKILAGWGDYLFYGFGNEAEDGLLDWFIGDLGVFREWLQKERREHQGRVRCKIERNADGSSSFVVFQLADLPEEFIVARKVKDKVQPQEGLFP